MSRACTTSKPWTSSSLNVQFVPACAGRPTASSTAAVAIPNAHEHVRCRSKTRPIARLPTVRQLWSHQPRTSRSNDKDVTVGSAPKFHQPPKNELGCAGVRHVALADAPSREIDLEQRG